MKNVLEYFDFYTGFLPRDHNAEGADRKIYKLLKVADLAAIENGNFDDLDEMELEVSPNLVEKYHVKQGRMLFVAKGRKEFPVVCLSETKSNVLISSHFIIGEYHGEEKDISKFLAAWFNTRAGQNQLLGVSRGSALHSLILSELKKLELMLPDIISRNRLMKLGEALSKTKTFHREIEEKWDLIFEKKFNEKMEVA